MMNKLKTIGIAVTGALLLWAGMVALNAIFGPNATTPSSADSSNVAPMVATAFMPNDAKTCTGCETTSERGLETSEMMSRDTHATTEISSSKVGPPYGSTGEACCIGVPLSTRTVAGGAEEAIGTVDSHVAYAPSTATVVASRHNSADAAPALQEGAASNNNDRNSGSADHGTLMSGNEPESDVLGSIDPGFVIDTIPGAHEPIMIAPETVYCVDSTSADCGDMREPAATDDKSQSGPDRSVSPQATLLPGPPDSPEMPDEPRPSPQIQQLVHIPPVPTEVPEPLTVVLFFIGLASMCTALRRKHRAG